MPFVKRCSQDLGFLTTGGLMYLVGGVLGLITCYFRGDLEVDKVNFLKNKYFYYRLLLFVLYAFLFFSAIGLVTTDKLPFIILLNYLWPTVVMILSIVILREKFRKDLLTIGSIIIIAGITLEVLGDRTVTIFSEEFSMYSKIASIMAFCGAMTWGLYSVTSRYWGLSAGGVIGIPFIMIATSTILFILRFLFNESSHFTIGLLPVLSYMLIMPYIAQLCWDIGVRKGDITLLSLLADGLPWLSLTISDISLGLTINSKTWIAAFLIICGAVISRFSMILARRQKNFC